MRCSVLLAGATATLILAGPIMVSRAAADYVDICVHGTGDEQIASCTAAIQSSRWSGKNLAWAHFNRGFAYRAKGDNDSAIADYSEAIRLDPRYSKAYGNRGNAYRAKGDYDRAVADYDQAIKIGSNEVQFDYNNRGLAYADKGDLDRAIADYSEAIRLDPKYGAAYNNRGDAYKAKGEIDRAIADYSEAIRLVPNNFSYVRDRGNALYLAGKYDLAIADYDKLIQFDPKAGDGLYGRGMAKLKKGDNAGGNADIAAAKDLEVDIAEQFAKYGIKS